TFGIRHFVERGAQTFGEFYGVVICPKMHEVKAWLFVEHVAVQGRYLNAVGAQRPNHRIDLVRGHHKVAGDCGLAVTGRLKSNSGRHAQWARWRQRHAVLGNGIASRHGKLIYATIDLALSADDFIELRAGEIHDRRGWRRRWRRE